MTERERISTALIDLCFEKGYRETTLPILCDRAGVDRATFERHFVDLEDCFCETYRERRDELMTRISAAVEDQPTWRDGMRAIAYTLVGYMEEDEKRTHFTVVEVRSAGDRAVTLMGEAFEEIFGLLDQGRGERSRQGSISRATAEAVGGAVFTQMYATYEAGSIESVRAKIPEMMYMAVLPYLGAEEAEKELHLSPHSDRGDG